MGARTRRRSRGTRPCSCSPGRRRAVHAVGHLLNVDATVVRRGRLLHRLGHGHRIVAGVGLDHRELAPVPVVTGGVRGELPVVVPAVVRVPGDRPLRVPGGDEIGRLVLDVEIAERGLVHRRLDAGDDVLAVDRGVNPVALPSTVIPTTCTFSGATTLPSRPFSSCSQRHTALGVRARLPRGLQKPCGVSQMSS